MWPVRLALVLVILAITGPAMATSRAQAEAGVAAYEQGKAKLASGDVEGAYLSFWEADALYPGVLPKYWLARCLDDMGQRDDAKTAYRAFLDAEPPAKHSELIRKADKRLAELERPAKTKKRKKAKTKKRKRTEAKKRSEAKPVAKAVAPPIVAPEEDDRTAMKVAGFTLLAATLGSAAGLAASFERAHNAPSPSDRNEYATATQALVPVTAALLLTTAIVLPLSYVGDEADAPKAEVKVGATGALVTVSF